MTLNVNTLSGSGSGIAIAEETSQKVAGTSWYVFPRVNSFASFKRNRTIVEDESISQTYQMARGRQTGYDAEGGFTVNAQPEMIRFAPGFMFADLNEGFSTVGVHTARATVDDVDGAGAYDLSIGSASGVSPGDLVYASGFSDAANNGLDEVSSNVGGVITVGNIGTVADASPVAAAKIEKVGFRGASGDIGLAVSGSLVTLTSTTLDFTTTDMVVGGWVFIGGDAAANQFGAGVGYARVSEINANLVRFDDVAWVGSLATDAGASKEIDVYVADFCRYEDQVANQTSRSYNVRRLIGPDANGMMSEYLDGAYLNTFKLSGGLDANHTAEFGFMALDKTKRDGTEGVKAGTEYELYDAERKPMVTPVDVFRLKLSISAAEHTNAAGLFAYASQFDFDINNQITVVRAVNATGGIDVNRGVAMVKGTVTAYIKDDALIDAIDADNNMSFNAIMALNNRGVVYDLPHLGSSDDGLNITKGEPVTLGVNMSGAMNRYGYSFGMSAFRYLPNAAMPTT